MQPTGDVVSMAYSLPKGVLPKIERLDPPSADEIDRLEKVRLLTLAALKFQGALYIAQLDLNAALENSSPT
jgi:hypothetical protein